MKLHIELDEKELRKLVMARLAEILGDVPLTAENVRIEVKSKQNYKSEWEDASFRAVLDYYK